MKKALFILVLCWGCAAAMAQNSASHVKDSTDLFYQHLELNEVVVTGLTGSTRLKEMPSPVTLVSPRVLRSTPSTNIIGAIARQGGISEITTGGAISKPLIRGLGYNRVVVLVDGVRQEGQQWGDEHGIEADGAAVHSVEILKGPASLMYGSDAMAGVMIFHPAPIAPAGTVNGEITAGYQSNNGLWEHSLQTGGNKGGCVWDLRYSGKNAGAYRNSADGPVPNSGFTERAASAMAGIGRKWGWSRLKFSLFSQRPGITEGERDPLTGALEGDAYGSRPALPFQKIEHYKIVSDNTFHLPGGSLKALLGWQTNNRREYEDSPDDCGLYFRLNTLSYDIRYTGGKGRWKFASGLGGMWQKSRNLGDEYLIPEYRLFDAGLFCTASLAAGQWSLSGGGRADRRALHSCGLVDDGILRFKDFRRNFTGITGSIGAVRSIGENTNVRINIARGFRAPNLSELASNGEHEGTLRYERGSSSLRPEFSLQGDAGADFSSKYISGQIALFANRISDFIFIAGTGETEEVLPVFGYFQGDAALAGMEASVDFHPIHALHFGESFSMVRGKLDSGDNLPVIPAPRLVSECKWEITHDGRHLNNSYLSVSLDYTFRQKFIYGAGETETPTPQYYLLGAGAGTDLLRRGRKVATVCIMAENLLDKAWQSHLSRLKYADVNHMTGKAGVFNMGRNFCIRISVPIQ